MKKIKTLGALKKSGYRSRSIKEELRENLISKLERREKVFEGIYGFDETVLPDIERAILSRHNILLLGLRGQAKTRIARLLTTLLDEYMPIVAGSEINDDPLQPLSNFAVTTISDLGDKTPIDWVHRDTRYVEKLATPDVSIADLIGDIDPIKAATLKLAYSDERVLHFGLIPRAHRSIFVINELPDLQARIQVSLFNILQEGDLQIRGFKLRLPLDIQFMFTANPEDYTNRGSIITPLKDRIESQILTHYPTEIEIATAITKQEANIHQEQKGRVTVPEVLHELLESVSFQARESEFVDEKSGVSARLSISGLENLVSNAERRAIKNKEKKTTVRITDFWGVVPAITGKLELVYEGEQVGPYQVAMNIIGAAIKEMFLDTFPHPDDHTRKQEKDPYGTIKAWFQAGNKVDLLNDDTDKNYKKKLDAISGLKIIVSNAGIPDSQIYTFMELML
ncbi:MAG TPA: magnesium chelatase, partial [Saprospirales bacterium]|nr:magnesium chelatase [Saprospirales bacterium]